MKVAGGGFEQCYNGQLAVDMDSLLIVTADAVQACNDKQQVEPALVQIKALPVELGSWSTWWRTRVTSPKPTSRPAVSSTSPR